MVDLKKQLLALAVQLEDEATTLRAHELRYMAAQLTSLAFEADKPSAVVGFLHRVAAQRPGFDTYSEDFDPAAVLAEVIGEARAILPS